MAKKKENKNDVFSNLVKDDNTGFAIYKKGAFIGALGGGVVGVIIRKRVMLWIVAGAIFGGYVAHQLNNKDNSLGIKRLKEKI